MIRPMPMLALVLVLVLALGACAQDAGPPALPGPTFEYSDRVGSSNVSESYLLERIHGQWAHNLGVVMGRLWMGAEPVNISTKTWPDNRTVVVGYDCGTPMRVTFKNLAYDPELSKIVYGKTVIDHTVPTELPGHAYLYDLTESAEPGKFNQTDSVTLEQTRSVTLTHSTDFNVTASSETTVGGSFAGVGVEEKITLATGLAFHDEEQRAQSESTSRTESHSFDVDLPAAEATLIVLDSTQVQSSTPFSLDAVASFAVRIKLGNHCAVSYPSADFSAWLVRGGCWITDAGCVGSKRENLDWCPPASARAHALPWAFIAADGCSFEFESVERLDQWLRGVHERWPGMGRVGPWVHSQCFGSAPCHGAYAALQDPDLRRVQLSGTQHRVYEDAIRETVQNVTGQDLDELLREHSAHDCDEARETCGSDPLPPQLGYDSPEARSQFEPHPDLDLFATEVLYLADGLRAGGLADADAAAARIIAAKIGGQG